MRAVVLSLLIGASPDDPSAASESVPVPVTTASASWPASAGPPPAGLGAAQAHALADPRRAAWIRRDRRLTGGLTAFAVVLGVFGGGTLIVLVTRLSDNFWVTAATLGGIAGFGAVGTVGFGVGRHIHRKRMRVWEAGLAGGGFTVRF